MEQIVRKTMGTAPQWFDFIPASGRQTLHTKDDLFQSIFFKKKYLSNDKNSIWDSTLTYYHNRAQNNFCSFC